MRAQFSRSEASAMTEVAKAPLRIPLFVYGTLRSDRCNARDLASFSPSVLKGLASGTLHYVDYVDDHGSRRVTVALNPSEPSASPVAGELVEFDEEDELHALAALDQRELSFQNGGIAANDRDYVYIRSLIKVIAETGEEVLAWTYVMVSKHFKPHVKVPANSDGIVEYEEITAEQYDSMLEQLTGNERPSHPPPLFDRAAESPWRHTALLIVAIAAYFMAYLLRVAPTTMSPALTRSIGVSATGLGALAAGYSYITMAMQVPAGILADRIGTARLIMTGCVVAAIGCCLFGMASGFALAAAGRILIGLGCSVLFVSMLKVIAVLYPVRFGSVTGIGMILGAAGSVCAGAPLAALMEATSWRVASICAGIACACVATVAWNLSMRTQGRKQSQSTAAIPAKQTPLTVQISQVLKLRTMWLCFAVNVGICGAFMSFTGLWAVPYLMATFGYDLVQASGHVSAYFAAFSLSCLVIGRLSDRLGNRFALISIGSAAFVVLLIVLMEMQSPTASSTYLVFVCLGVASTAFTLTWGVAKDAVSPSASGLAMGLVNTGGFAGAALLQQIAGGLMDLLWQGQSSGPSGLRVYGASEYRACLGSHVILAVFGLVAAALLWHQSRRGARAKGTVDQPIPSRPSEKAPA